MSGITGQQQAAAFSVLTHLLSSSDAALWANRRDPFTMQEFCDRHYGRMSGVVEGATRDVVHKTLLTAGWRFDGAHYIRAEPTDPANDHLQTHDEDSEILERPVAAFHLIDDRPTTAFTILHDAADAIANRAASRDVESERSMARCVASFNAMTGHQLTEVDGWLFMVFLKSSRARAGAYNPDDYLDATAYFGLAGEAAHIEAQP